MASHLLPGVNVLGKVIWKNKWILCNEYLSRISNLEQQHGRYSWDYSLDEKRGQGTLVSSMCKELVI